VAGVEAEVRSRHTAAVQRERPRGVRPGAGRGRGRQGVRMFCSVSACRPPARLQRQTNSLPIVR